MSAHICHAEGCGIPCRPEHLMCGRHWAKVPAGLQRVVYRTYRPGQCDDKKPSKAWVIAATRAIRAVAIAEHRDVDHLDRKLARLDPPRIDVHRCEACGEPAHWGFLPPSAPVGLDRRWYCGAHRERGEAWLNEGAGEPLPPVQQAPARQGPLL